MHGQVIDKTVIVVINIQDTIAKFRTEPFLEAIADTTIDLVGQIRRTSLDGCPRHASNWIWAIAAAVQAGSISPFLENSTSPEFCSSRCHLDEWSSYCQGKESKQ